VQHKWTKGHVALITEKTRFGTLGRQNADIVDTLHLSNVAMATAFWLLMGYNFGWLYKC